MADIKRKLMDTLIAKAEARGETLAEKEAARLAEETLQKKRGAKDVARDAAESDPMMKSDKNESSIMSPKEFKEKLGTAPPKVTEEFRKQYVGPTTDAIPVGAPRAPGSPSESNLPVPYIQPGKLQPIDNLGEKYKAYQKTRIMPDETPSVTESAAELAGKAMGIDYKAKKGMSTGAKVAAGSMIAGTGAGAYMGMKGKAKGQEEAPAPSEPSKSSAEAPATAKPPKAATNKENQAALDKTERSLPSPLLPGFQDERARLEGLRVRALENYDKNRERADWGRVAEMLSRAMMKLAAGYAGLKSGHDLSGAVESGEKWDWKTDYDNMANRVKLELDGIESNKADLGRREAAAGKEAADVKNDARSYKQAIDVAKIHAGSAAAARTAKEDSQTKAASAKDIASKEKADAALLKSINADMGDKKKSAQILKNEDNLRLWATGKFGPDAAEEIVSQGVKGEWWGIDDAQSKRAIAEQIAKLSQAAPSQAPEPAPEGVEEERLDQKTGKTAIFKDKQFVRWKK